MQIHFTTTIRTSLDHKDDINAVIDFLEKKGHKVSRRAKIYEKEDSKGGAGMELIATSKEMDVLTQVYLLNQKRILNSDIVICEMSTTTSGLGYDVAQALLANKPVLVLCSDGNKLTETLTGNKSKKLWAKYYNSDNLIQIVESFVQDAKKMLDSKFILILPPEIERYLSWASNKKGLRKAEIVRSAIEKYMEHDLDYKKYITDLEK